MNTSLPDNQKILVQEYLATFIGRWGKWLGFANLAVLGGSLIYVFFILPQYALSDASNRLSAQLDSQSQRLEEKLPEIYELSGSLRQAVDEVQRTIQLVHEKRANAEKELEAIQTQIKGLKAKPEYQIAEAIEALDKAGNAQEILDKLTKLTRLVFRPINLFT